jgi:hypothetical protein
LVRDTLELRANVSELVGPNPAVAVDEVRGGKERGGRTVPAEDWKRDLVRVEVTVVDRNRRGSRRQRLAVDEMPLDRRHRDHRVMGAQILELLAERLRVRDAPCRPFAEAMVGENEDLALVGASKGGEHPRRAHHTKKRLLHPLASVAIRLFHLDNVVRAQDADRRPFEAIELPAQTERE